MKVLIVETNPVKPHLETAAELAFRFSENKRNSVKFAWLGDGLPWSEWQIPNFLKVIGLSYINRIKIFEEILSDNNIDIIDSKKFVINNITPINNWSTSFNGKIKDLINFKYKNFALGKGVASSLISYYRDENLNLSKIKCVSSLLLSSALILERCVKLFKLEKPDCIITFNSRFATSLPIILAAKNFGIKILRHERGSDFKKFEIFKKDIHNYDYIANEVYRYWNNAPKNKRNLIATNYFHKRRNNKPIGINVGFLYTKLQKKNFIDYKKKKRLIVYYTSTDYEQIAINNNFDQEKKFNILYSVISKMKDTDLIIRVHPDLYGKNYIEDKKWEKYSSSNTKVIFSNDKTDTYKLMDIADIVVSFSSNIVIESVFWGKNTVSLSDGMLFSKANLCVFPKNFSEYKKIFAENFIFKKVNKNKALPFGYYFESFGKEFKYYKPKNYYDGLLLGRKTDWKPKIIVLLEYLKIKKIYNYFYKKLK